MGEHERHKRCAKCGKEKPASGFYKASAQACGLRARCIECERGRDRRPSPPRSPEQQAHRREKDRARRQRDRRKPTATCAPGTPGVVTSVHGLTVDTAPSAERWLLVRPCRTCRKLAKMHAMQTICHRCEPRATEQDVARQKRWEAKQRERANV